MRDDGLPGGRGLVRSQTLQPYLPPCRAHLRARRRPAGAAWCTPIPALITLHSSSAPMQPLPARVSHCASRVLHQVCGWVQPCSAAEASSKFGSMRCLKAVMLEDTAEMLSCCALHSCKKGHRDAGLTIVSLARCAEPAAHNLHHQQQVDPPKFIRSGLSVREPLFGGTARHPQGLPFFFSGTMAGCLRPSSFPLGLFLAASRPAWRQARGCAAATCMKRAGACTGVAS